MFQERYRRICTSINKHIIIHHWPMFVGGMSAMFFSASGAVRGKTAIVTGGAQGIGEAYVRALINAGAHVVIGDIDIARAEALVSEFPSKLHFSKCDVTNWEDQVSLFQEARTSSRTKLIHVVVANAGVSREEDEVFTTEHENQDEPSEPTLKMTDVNLKGVFYTTKLALHHFRRQHAAAVAEGNEQPPETNLVLQGSIASYLDSPSFCEYAASKWAVRGLMWTLRSVVPAHGTRVNNICPSFIKTALIPHRLLELLDANGIALATCEDAGECLLRILSDREINGRALCVVARNSVEQAPRGYYDMDSEGMLEGPWLKMSK